MIRCLPLLTAALLVVLACSSSVAGAQVPAPNQPAGCPSFQVLRDDRIGALPLPAGPYAVSVGTPATLTCAQAADLFRQFLQDFDGRLPGGWRVDAATSSFSRAGGTQAFSVAAGVPATPLTPAVVPASGDACPGSFQVLHDDRVGSLAIPAGAYTVTLVAAGRMTCAQAMSRLTAFLTDYDGRLPGWTVDAETGTFLRGSANVGFRIEPAAPAPAGPGAQVAPLPLDGAPCPGTFRVLHDDRIGRLTLSAGRYLVAPLSSSSLSCADTSSLLRRFLAAAGDRLPAPWVVSRATGTFTRGRGSDVGFRVKPVS